MAIDDCPRLTARKSDQFFFANRSDRAAPAAHCARLDRQHMTRCRIIANNSNFRTWPEAEVAFAPSDVCSQRQSGHQVDGSTRTACDPGCVKTPML
jgi:hypothetical protein